MPIGCAAIGKVLYRTTDLIVDDLTSGGERFGRELATFIVDPMRGITRIVTGCAWEKRNTSSRRFGIPPISIELSLWARLPTFRNCCRTTKEVGVGIIYRIWRPLRGIINTPYSYFSCLMELQMMKTQPVHRMEIMVRLLSHEIIEHKDYKRLRRSLPALLFLRFRHYQGSKDSRSYAPVRRALQNGHPGIYRHRNYVTEPSWVLDGNSTNNLPGAALMKTIT